MVYQFKTMPDGRGLLVCLSPGIQEICEGSPAERYADENALTGAILPDDRAAHRAPVEAALNALAPCGHEHRRLTRGGRIKWVRGQAVPEKQADGSVTWSGIPIDVRKRKRAKEALVESENRFRRVISMTSDLVIPATARTAASSMSSGWAAMRAGGSAPAPRSWSPPGAGGPSCCPRTRASSTAM